MDVLILTFNTLSTYGVLVNPLLNKVLNSVIEVVMKTKQTFSLRQLNGGTCNKSKEINEMYSYGLLEYNFFTFLFFMECHSILTTNTEIQWPTGVK